MTTIEACIASHAAQQPDKLAIVCGADRCTYAALHARIEAEMAARQTLAAGDATPARPADACDKAAVVPLRAEPSADFLASYFALHRLGLVAAPLARDMAGEVFKRVADKLRMYRCPPGTADVLYTTGTTGQAKGVMVSHAAIMADAENLIAGQGYTSNLGFVVSGPLNHIGSLSKVYPVLMLGATLIIVDGLKDLAAFFSAFDTDLGTEQKKYATFLVPASIRILMQLAPERMAALASRLDFVETGAAAMARADMERLCTLLPTTRLYNTYASTETGIVCTHNFNDGAPDPQLVGNPLPHSRVTITDDGLIACGGRTLMTGYVGDEEGTGNVLRGGMVYTRDVGAIDSEGRLRLLGRQDDVINVGGYKVAPTEVESAALGHPCVADCVCTATDHKIMGKALRLLVVQAPGTTLDKRSLARFLSERLEAYKVPTAYEQVDSIHRTFNGKIDRKHYQRG